MLPVLLLALPEDRPLSGFAGLAEGQTVLPEHVLGYAEIARAVAQDPAAGTFLEAHDRCGQAVDRPEAFVRSAGAILFRGPVPDESVARIAEVCRAVTEIADAGAGRRAALEVMLQSPRFLYLVEMEPAGEPAAAGPYALASRLAVGLWSSAPDAALLADAEAGRLGTPEGLEAAAARLLDDPAKVARVWRRFVLDWARLESLPEGDGLKADLQDGAVAFLLEHLASGGAVLDLFEPARLYLTPRLARARDLPSAGPGVQAFPSGPGARGFLAQPGVVAGMTNADGGAIVARGLFLQAQLFCGEPPTSWATAPASSAASSSGTSSSCSGKASEPGRRRRSEQSRRPSTGQRAATESSSGTPCDTPSSPSRALTDDFPTP